MSDIRGSVRLSCPVHCGVRTMSSCSLKQNMHGVISPHKHPAGINSRTAKIRGRVLSPATVASLAPSRPAGPAVPPRSGWRLWRAESGAPTPHCHSARVPPFPLLAKGQPEVCAGAIMGEQSSPASPATAQALGPRTSRHTRSLRAPSPSLPSLSALQMTLRSRGWWMI